MYCTWRGSRRPQSSIRRSTISGSSLLPLATTWMGSPGAIRKITKFRERAKNIRTTL